MGVVVAAIASVSLLITAQYVPIRPGDTSDLGEGWSLSAPATVDGSCTVMKLYQAYPNFHLFRLSMYPSGHFGILVADQNWRSIEAKKHYEIGLQLGAKDVWKSDAIGVSKEDLGLPDHDREAFGALYVHEIPHDFVERATQSYSMSVIYKSKVIAEISLLGLPGAMRKLNECHELLASGQGKPRDPFASAD